MRPGGRTWDLVVVGAGPAGAATALGALRADSGLRVLLLDRATFPRDKACGDGIAAQALDLLATVGVRDRVADQTPIPELRLVRGCRMVARTMARPAYVVPRRLFDARLVEAAVEGGAVLRHHRVRSLSHTTGGVVIDDGVVTGRVVVGADGAHSVVARAMGVQPGPRAVALRGYAPVADGRRGAQVIAFGSRGRPAYAWSFDRGDGWANVGYGEGLGEIGDRLTKAQLLGQLEDLLPGATIGGRDWCAHPLPLSTWHPLRPVRGGVLLTGDAAGLVNPLTGEGIFYAVASGLLAGAAAAVALRTGADPAEIYERDVRRLLAGHLRHTALAARLGRYPRVLEAGVGAAAADQGVFDDFVELGLARGRLTGARSCRHGPSADTTRRAGRTGRRSWPGSPAYLPGAPACRVGHRPPFARRPGGPMRILSVRGVVPENRYPQAEITEAFAGSLIGDGVDRALVERFHRNAGVRTRHLAVPLEQYAKIGDYGAANDTFIRAGTELGARAVTDALKAAGLTPQDVDLIVSATVTGFAVPTLDARIASLWAFVRTSSGCRWSGWGASLGRPESPGCTTTCWATQTGSPSSSLPSCVR